MNFRVLYSDSQLIAIDKPEGMHVHPPEDPTYRPPDSQIVLFQLRDQIGKYLYPVHRLDFATSGVLIFALSSSSARDIASLFEQRKVEKNYQAVVRGWPTNNSGEVQVPLSNEAGVLQEAFTRYECQRKMRLLVSVGKRHPEARYSHLTLRPKTGRFHQLRRHCARLTHPIVGDSDHGDLYHNRFFRDQLKIPGLCLRATELVVGGIQITAANDEKWDRVDRLFKENQVQ